MMPTKIESGIERQRRIDQLYQVIFEEKDVQGLRTALDIRLNGNRR